MGGPRQTATITTMLPLAAAGAAAALCLLLGLLLAPEALAHNISAADRAFMQASKGTSLGPYVYLGAKHMVTGYDHLMYLAGVIFFLRSLRDVAAFVSLFALGHSITLLFGVLADVHVNVYAIDAVIGFSVAYKAFENLSGFRTVLGTRLLEPRLAVFAFGLCHGFGLASKLQDLALPRDGLVANILAFNLGVELGQMTALAGLLILIESVRRLAHYGSVALGANAALMAGGFTLVGYQLAGLVAGEV